MRGHLKGLAVPLFALARQAFKLRYQHAFRQMPPEPPRHVQAQGVRVEAGRVEGVAVVGAPEFGAGVFGVAGPLAPGLGALSLVCLLYTSDAADE